MTAERLGVPSPPYQVMPPLTDAEFAALKADILVRGVLVAVEFDETGEVLDGHHRLQACHELGITSYPRVVRAGLSDAEKRAHALALNVNRRHLSVEQRAEAVGALRGEGWSVRRIAAETGVPKSTVARDLVRVDSPAQPDSVVGTDGKTYPASRRPTTVYVQSEHQQRQAVDALASIPEGGVPARTVDLRRLRRIGREARSTVARTTAARGTLSPSVDLRHNPIDSLVIDPGTVDLVFTDPPYRREDLEAGLWHTLGTRSATWLKPGGLLATYMPTMWLPMALAALADSGLEYWWTHAIVHPRGRGVRQVRQRAVGSAWRPLVIHRQPGGEDMPPWTLDRWDGTGRSKDTGHPWEQAVGEAVALIAALTNADALIVDPFCGSGTVALATLAAGGGRQCIAADADAGCVAMTRGRIGPLDAELVRPDTADRALGQVEETK